MLIFSGFKDALDLLQQYFHGYGWPTERLDGQVIGDSATLVAYYTWSARPCVCGCLSVSESCMCMCVCVRCVPAVHATLLCLSACLPH
jgi:hypothetical protein